MKVESAGVCESGAATDGHRVVLILMGPIVERRTGDDGRPTGHTDRHHTTAYSLT